MLLALGSIIKIQKEKHIALRIYLTFKKKKKDMIPKKKKSKGKCKIVPNYRKSQGSCILDTHI